MDVRKAAIVVIVAVLSLILVITLIDAVFPEPDYGDYCVDEMYSRPMPVKFDPQNCTNIQPTDQELKACNVQGGDIQYQYDAYGCVESYACSMCRKDFETAQGKHNLKVFLCAAGLGFLFIILGFILPLHKNPINDFVGSGFMFGGIVAIFYGTIRYFRDMSRTLRPIIIFIELVIIIALAYLKFKQRKK